MARVDTEANVYRIPTNFIEGGRILNGLFKSRNFAEAVAYILLMFGILSPIHFGSTSAKISWMIILIGPGALIVLMGINDEPISSYLVSIFRWRKGRKIMLYNENAELHEQRAADYIINRELPRDKLERLYHEWKKKHDERLDEEALAYGDDVIFAPDQTTIYINDSARRRRAIAKVQDKKREQEIESDMSELEAALANASDVPVKEEFVLKLDSAAFGDEFED